MLFLREGMMVLEERRQPFKYTWADSNVRRLCARKLPWSLICFTMRQYKKWRVKVFQKVGSSHSSSASTCTYPKIDKMLYIQHNLSSIPTKCQLTTKRSTNWVCSAGSLASVGEHSRIGRITSFSNWMNNRLNLIWISVNPITYAPKGPHKARQSAIFMPVVDVNSSLSLDQSAGTLNCSNRESTALVRFLEHRNPGAWNVK